MEVLKLYEISIYPFHFFSKTKRFIQKESMFQSGGRVMEKYDSS